MPIIMGYMDHVVSPDHLFWLKLINSRGSLTVEFKKIDLSKRENFLKSKIKQKVVKFNLLLQCKKEDNYPPEVSNNYLPNLKLNLKNKVKKNQVCEKLGKENQIFRYETAHYNTVLKQYCTLPNSSLQCGIKTVIR